MAPCGLPVPSLTSVPAVGDRAAAVGGQRGCGLHLQPGWCRALVGCSLREADQRVSGPFGGNPGLRRQQVSGRGGLWYVCLRAAVSTAPPQSARWAGCGHGAGVCWGEGGDWLLHTLKPASFALRNRELSCPSRLENGGDQTRGLCCIKKGVLLGRAESKFLPLEGH